MKIKSFEFNLRELAGSMGDFGTLFPLAIGYIAVCGINPSGLLITMGLANIITGFVYRIPMPIEPMKVIAVVAIAQHWAPSMVYASGFAMGIIWLIFALTGIIDWIAKLTPNSIIRGIQITLGILLVVEAFKMISSWWLLGIFSIFIVLLFKNNRFAPAAIVLITLGIGIMFIKGQFQQMHQPAISFPYFTSFTFNEVWQTLFLAGFAQIPLTITNATISTSSLIKTYWPEKPVSERKLSWNQGIMNIIIPFFGGMPLCHGAGGLAGQYYFGARTGGTNIIEGIIEVLMGLFLANAIAEIFSFFPSAIIGAMMFMVGVELTKFAKDIHVNKDIIIMSIVVIISLITNMAFGFLVGLVIYYILKFDLLKKNFI